MKKVIFIIILSLVLFLPSLNVFFSGDDFFHLRISQINSFTDFLSFFSFEKNEYSGSFYRPLTTQVFFLFGQSLFGLNPFGYHLFALSIFAILLYLVFLLAKKLFNDEKIAILVLFFYAFSVSHFTQVYYLSAFQELGMAAFYFAGLLFWLKFLESREIKPYLFTLLFVIFSLLSKETAVTFPLVAGLLTLYQKKQKQLIFLTPLLLIEGVYLYFRLVKFGGVVGESYLWDFSPRIFNTLGWYLAWAIGIPEMSLDFIGPKLAVNPNLLLYYPWQTKIILGSFIIFMLLSVFSVLRNIKTKLKLFTIYYLLFTITLLPVLFLPWHKFPLELSVPMLFIALFFGTLFSKSSRFFLFLSFSVFLLLNFTSYLLTYQTHWVTRRGEVARKVVDYFTKQYAQFPQDKSVYFYNNSAFITEGWGASRHIWTALSGSDALQVFYKNQNIKVFYEDIDGQKEEKNLIRLGTKEFLGY